MKLEVGKYYRNKRNEVIRIMEENKFKVYSFEDEYGRTYNSQGYYGGSGHSNNLIEEVIVTPVKEKKPELKLEVGKKYRMRNGGIALITNCNALHSNSEFPYHAGIMTYTEDGKYSDLGYDHEWDLIEEIE